MPTLLFPSSAELSLIERSKIPLLTMDDPVFTLMPIETVDAAKVEWEQKDNFTGLMQVRGLNGEAPNIRLLGGKRYDMDPGRYGEHVNISEGEIEKRRAWGSFNAPIPIGDLVAEAQDRLLARRIDRIRWINWKLLTTGTFSVPGPGGTIVHTDTFSLQTATAAVAWATIATAKPLYDFRELKKKARGYSVRFDRSAVAYMNLTTANNLLANTNANDLYGKRTDQGETFNSVEQVNRVLAANDCPQIEIYDEGYFDDTNSDTFTPFIADGKVCVVGKRTTGEPIGKFKMTRNAVNPGAAPGPYTFVTYSQDRDVPVPGGVRVDDGFNGGPTMEFPSAVVMLDVS